MIFKVKCPDGMIARPTILNHLPNKDTVVQCLKPIQGKHGAVYTASNFRIANKNLPSILVICEVLSTIVSNNTLFLSQSDRGPTCFTFQKKDEQAYVKLHPIQEEVLNDFTVDFSYEFSYLAGGAFFLSYAIPQNANEILFGSYGWYGTANYDFPREINTTNRFTLTRVNSKISVYSNQNLVLETTSPQSVRTGGVWLLGQDQDSVEGGFEIDDRFVGKICNFQMWNYGMNRESLGKLFRNDGSMARGNFFDSPPSYAFERKNGAM